MVLVIGFSASALASCGDSVSAMAAQAASIHSQSSLTQRGSESSRDNAVNSSIVGLWLVQFIVGGQTIQEAYQLWNVGGTEVHNPNVDPRSGNVCLGCGRRRLLRLTSSLTACGRTTRTETFSEPSTSVRRSLWETAAIRTAAPSPWISTTLPALSNSRWRAASQENAFRLSDPRCFARLRRAAVTARLFPVVCLRSRTRFQEARERSSGELLSVVLRVTGVKSRLH
jgi:hypothetical protein